ncbi:MAG: ComEC/Rec2 family competence protein [Treponema sp.]|nr:ComEC/Rec2 family competence protein [Treponema sp.]
MVKNPVLIAALILAFLFYSGLVKIKARDSFRSLAPREKIVKVEGSLVSNPVKSKVFGSTYKSVFSVRKVFTKKGEFSAEGKIVLYFPSEIVEACYPGKLYSVASSKISGDFILESGAELCLKVKSVRRAGETSYLVEKGKFIGWKGNSMLKAIKKIRALSRIKFKKLMYAWGKAGGLLLALLTGSREYTDSLLCDAFRDAGLSHILALSGMHLGLFNSLARFLGKKTGGNVFSQAAGLSSVIFFVWFAGFSPSLFRAFLSVGISTMNTVLRLGPPSQVSLLSLSFILHSVIFPEHIRQPAFVLSYVSLFGITVLKFIFVKILPSVMPLKFRLSLSESISAQCATCPVVLRFFGKIAPVGIIASLFLSPLITFFIYFGLFGIIICLLLPFLSGPINAIMNTLYFFISSLVLFFGGSKNLVFRGELF